MASDADYLASLRPHTPSQLQSDVQLLQADYTAIADQKRVYAQLKGEVDRAIGMRDTTQSRSRAEAPTNNSTIAVQLMARPVCSAASDSGPGGCSTVNCAAAAPVKWV